MRRIFGYAFGAALMCLVILWWVYAPRPRSWDE